MSPKPETKNDDDMLKEYDFSNGVRGKYFERYQQGTNVVLLDPDVAEIFPSAKAVNDALRSLVLATPSRSRSRRQQRSKKVARSKPLRRG
jgi:hypothetical protein